MYLTEEQILRDQEIMQELLNYDTPSITNAVPPIPRIRRTAWVYTIPGGEMVHRPNPKCMFPEMGRRIGYAVTCVYGLPDPNYKRGSNIGSVVDAILASPSRWF